MRNIKKQRFVTKDVQIGTVYVVKISETLRPIRIASDLGLAVDRGGRKKHRGWIGLNLETGKRVTIKSAARLRMKCPLGLIEKECSCRDPDCNKYHGHPG